ncbi:aminotransferase [Hygrophoropsis aurantiaca]|uniref:Aminotransferase n=1 Tax=Hygrophoropsis aurantiaca TaxID=72124 RepID=A0ACB8AQ75_9AGAM|nr:aminotransferase [Hygrophoropsis aurantiaca]
MSFSLLSSTRYDPFLRTLRWNNDPEGNPSPYLLLSYQLDRLVASAHRNGWGDLKALNWDNLKSTCDNIVGDELGQYKTGALKIRMVLSSSGELTATASAVEPFVYDPTAPSFFNPQTDSHLLFDPVMIIHVDSQPTIGTVTMKTTDRQAYDDARTRAGVNQLNSPPTPSHQDSDQPDDVLLYNQHRAITESSICNVSFHRGGRWITPPLAAGCISGVVRRWLLEQGRIFEAAENEILLDSIEEDEMVLVSNGVIGCRLGRVKLSRSLAKHIR